MSNPIDIISKHISKGYTENTINWIEEDGFSTWDSIKLKSRIMWGHGKEYDPKSNIKKLFLSHSSDKICGRPQLIDQTKKRVPLVRWAIKKKRVNNEEEESTSGSNKEIVSQYFFDDKFDKRYNGSQIDAFALDFWMYRVITKIGKEYYILSEEQLPNEVCDFTGMIVEMDDFAEISRSMKLKSLSRIMFIKSCNPSVKILPPEDIIKFTQTREFTEEKFLKFLAYHPKLNSYNRFPMETEKLKAAQLLSSKVDNYPLHLGVIGIAGSRKSKGFVETTAYKFDALPKIIEGANSRIKGLSPSFKEKPANLGYLVNCERVGYIDELSKMIEAEQNKHDTTTGNVLGEINALLDHSIREVTSGNDNAAVVQATSKYIFVMNPVTGKKSIGQHVGALDPTTMSRIFWWVQDSDEIEFVQSSEGIIRNKSSGNKKSELSILKDDEDLNNKTCWTDFSCREEYLTLYDTCQSFICPIDDTRVEKIADMITNLARHPMKDIWRPRGSHHVKLLIDGLAKLRCLFTDYDPQFLPVEDDYILAERILIRMVKSWETDFSIIHEKPAEVKSWP